MTVEEMMRKISDLRKLAESLDKISMEKEDCRLTVSDTEDIDDAAEAIRDYIEELGRKKVV